MDEDDLECAFCHEIFRDPVNLPCGHILCNECAKKTEQYAIAKKSEPKCSTCSESWKIGKKLPPNRHMQSMIDKYRPNQPKKPDPIISDASKAKSDGSCNEHAQKTVALCLQCGDVMVCGDCIISGKHRGHNYQTIAEYKADINQQLDSQKKICEDFQKVFDGIFKDIEKQITIEEKNQKETTEEIKRSFKLAHQALDKREAELIQKVDKIYTPQVLSEKYRIVKDQIEQLKRLNEKLKGETQDLSVFLEKKKLAENQLKSAQSILEIKNFDRMPITKIYRSVDVSTINQQIATLGKVSRISAIPTKLNAKHIDSYSFQLDWECSDKELQPIRYEIELQCGKSIKKFQSKSPSHLFQILEPGTEYVAKVCAITKEGASEWSEVIKVKTKPIVPAIRVMQEHGYGKGYEVSNTLKFDNSYWCSNEAVPPRADPLAYQFDRDYRVSAIEIWPNPSYPPREVVIERRDGNIWVPVKKIIVTQEDKIQVFDGFLQTGSQWRLRLVTGYHGTFFGVCFVAFVGVPA